MNAILQQKLLHHLGLVSSFCVHLVISYLINLGSVIGYLLYYYVSEIFQTHPDPILIDKIIFY